MPKPSDSVAARPRGLPLCGVCRVRPTDSVITITDMFGKRRRVYACALCSDASRFGFR